MSVSPVISGLVTKRTELGRELTQRQEEVRALYAAIENIDGAIKLFDPDYDLRAIKAKAKYTVNPWFEHGEVGRLVLNTLRMATGALSTRQIGDAIVAAKGLRVEGASEWDWLLKMVLGAARRLETKGIIKTVGRVKRAGNGPVLWQIV